LRSLRECYTSEKGTWHNPWGQESWVGYHASGTVVITNLQGCFPDVEKLFTNISSTDKTEWIGTDGGK